ncbi:hypothetical protein [Marilutibacter alkalisoli]|uniref:Uncharacterized protein n=1 Tax=Marilutibacter alkalisoli TaxID=2591633 RepID=A0A514BR88_9GAMM|nr:hypothetical protein [Lysobacter alkalisoli]QDH69918.1 hypothetical protein FKV23_07300 [Lysobacter alkalisoli]
MSFHMVRLPISLTLALVATASSIVAAAQDTGKKPYIFDMYDQFVISNAAAKACSPPDTQSKARHDANFATVTTHVRRILMSDHYKKSPAEIDKLLAGRKVLLDKEVSEKIAQIGCNNTDVQTITRRYKAQVDWQPPRS